MPTRGVHQRQATLHDSGYDGSRMHGTISLKASTHQGNESHKQVVRLHRKGYGVLHIVELSGLSYPAVHDVIDLYDKAVRLRPSPLFAASKRLLIQPR